MVGALFDTNILVDHLNAVPRAREEIARFESRAVSIITWMEVMVGADRDLEAATRSFLNGFDVIAVDEHIAERAVGLRRFAGRDSEHVRKMRQDLGRGSDQQPHG